MGTIIINSVDVIPLSDDHMGTAPVVRGVDIEIQGGRIQTVGKVDDQRADTVIDGRGLLAVPGLINTHCHAAMTLQRGWAEDLPFPRWLNERIWVAESALEQEDVRWGAALAACEMIRSGTIGFCDHYFWMDEVADIVRQSGMRALLSWCHFGLPPDQEVGGTTLERTATFAKTWHGAADGRIRVALGPHSPYMCSPEVLAQTAELAVELGVGVHLHLAESAEQVQNSVERHGRGPIKLLEHLGLLDLPLLAAHCIAADDEDLALLARPNVVVAHTPKTYMKLAMAMAPLARMLDAGVNVGLGTDGPASNADLNLLEVMRLTGLWQKIDHGRAEAMPMGTLLRLACQGGAAALADGQTPRGRVEAGAAADLMLLDTSGPHWAPGHDPAASLVYASHPSDVRTVICDGRVLMRDGVILTLDEDKIVAEARARGLALVKRGMQRVRKYHG